MSADFREHEAVYVPLEGRPHRYAEWMRAFELAADGGLVSFH